MTKDEIKLVVFFLLSLLIGVAAQWWNTRSPHSESLPEPAQSGWAKPPYVFKNRKQMEKAAADVKAVDSAHSADTQ